MEDRGGGPVPGDRGRAPEQVLVGVGGREEGGGDERCRVVLHTRGQSDAGVECRGSAFTAQAEREETAESHHFCSTNLAEVMSF